MIWDLRLTAGSEKFGKLDMPLPAGAPREGAGRVGPAPEAVPFLEKNTLKFVLNSTKHTEFTPKQDI